jgi:flagellar basal-body rod protein FlgG
MLDSFHIAATGMHAQQLNLDVVANNLANLNTSSFKKSRVDFEDLMYRQVGASRGLVGSPDISNPIGAGAAVSSVGKIFSLGEIKQTGRSLDIAIRGDGFMEVLLPDGSQAYTRAGALQIDSDGMVVNADGYPLSPLMQVPADAEGLLIKPDGEVMAQITGETRPVEIGRIELASFVNPGGLTPSGDNLYLPSRASGDVFYTSPGEDGTGVLEQGALEGSNVNLVEELTNLILAQRGYEMNARVIQAADDLLGIVNDLRR